MLRQFRALALAALALLAAPAAAEGPLVVGNARLGEHDGATRFVLDMSHAVEARVQALQDPPRLAIDLPAGSFEPPAEPPVRGLVTGLRHGALEGGGMRLVLDLARDGGVAASFVLPEQNGRAPRLVVDIEAVEAHFRSASLSDDIGDLVARYSAGTPAVSAVSAAPSAIVVPPPGAGRRSQRQTQRVIVLDPGHGGKDPGAIGVNGAREKDIVLAVAKKLKALLEANGNYKVVLTRGDDSFIRLRDRPGVARKLKADLFMSLHADSVARGSARGASVYTLSDKASDRESAKLAEQENHSDAIAGIDIAAGEDDVFELLLSLSQRDTMNRSRGFATHLLGELGSDVKLLHSSYKSAGFAVLTAPDIPAVLVELGFMSSHEESRLLATPAHQQKLALSLKRAVDGWFGAE